MKYFKIYDFILEDKKLNLAEKIVYCVIDAMMQERGYCWASNKSIAQKIGVSDITVQRAIDKLYKMHYISKWKRRNRNMVYRVMTTNKTMLISEEQLFELKRKSTKEVALFDYDWLNERD